MEDYFWIEVIAAITFPVALITLIMNATEKDRAMSGGNIQILAIGSGLPIILILGLERVFEPGTIGALLGGILGYVFSSSDRITSRS